MREFVRSAIERHDTALVAKAGFERMFPSILTTGPWHETTSAFLLTVVAGLALIKVELGSADFHTKCEEKQVMHTVTKNRIRGILGLYGLSVMVWMRNLVGISVIVSYTMQSWMICTTRYCAGYMASLLSDNSPWKKRLTALDEGLRFPSLVQNTTTFAVWWMVLTPILLLSLKNGDQRKQFMKWNTSPFLLTVHGLNLPFAVADRLMSPRSLCKHDLFSGVALSVSYLLFYLEVLDRNGLHLYIILSPRTRFAPFVYGAIIHSYISCWRFYDKLGKHFARKDFPNKEVKET